MEHRYACHPIPNRLVPRHIDSNLSRRLLVNRAAVTGRIKSFDGGVIILDGKVYHVMLFGSTISDADLAELAESEALAGIKELNLGKTQISDDGLASLSNFSELEVLWLQFTAISDAGLAHVAETRQLRSLDLRDVPVTDKGMAHLAQLPNLDRVDLSGTKITDAGLVHLSELKSLRSLRLGETAVTDAGVRRLQLALPNCEISEISPREMLEGLRNLKTLRGITRR